MTQATARKNLKIVSSQNKFVGLKHTCVSCGTPFYDLKQVPAVCPKCKTAQTADNIIRLKKLSPIQGKKTDRTDQVEDLTDVEDLIIDDTDDPASPDIEDTEDLEDGDSIKDDIDLREEEDPENGLS